ncbi:transglutaminase domain-containing protein [Chitinophaga lutea]
MKLSARKCLSLSLLLAPALSLCIASPPAHRDEKAPATGYYRADKDNIVISDRKERYEFTRGDDAHPVWIKQFFNTTYRCNGFRTSVPYVETYDDYSRVDEVRAWENGSRIKKLKPEHGYHSIEGLFYSDARICGFMLPLEMKGSESRVELEKTVLDPRYFTTVYFQEDFRVEQKEVVIVVPRWMKLDIHEKNFDKARISKHKSFDASLNADVYTYRARKVDEYKKEPNAPGPSYVYPHLLICSHYADLPKGKIDYFANVSDLYDWYRSLVKEIGNEAATVKTMAEEIVKGKTKPEDKVKAVYTWVQENIRYIAFEDGIAGFRPAKAQDVLQKKYGDCKGMANLTKEILVSLGFDARLCWIGTRHIAYDYSTPSLSVDNHMICAVNLAGKQYFLDATETYIGFDQYAERIQGRQVLIENGDKYQLSNIPQRTFEQNKLEERRKLRIEGNNLIGSATQRYTGEYTEYLLTQAHSIKKSDIQEAMSQYLSAGNRLYTVSALETSNLHDWNTDLSIKYNLEHKDAVNSFGSESYVEMDFRKELENAEIDTTDRKQDLWLPFKRQTVQETALALPAGVGVKSLPAPLQIDRPKYAFKISYVQKGNEVIYRKELTIRDTKLQQSDFSQWNADIRQLREACQEQLTLVKK